MKPAVRKGAIHAKYQFNYNEYNKPNHHRCKRMYVVQYVGNSDTVKANFYIFRHTYFDKLQKIGAKFCIICILTKSTLLSFNTFMCNIYCSQHCGDWEETFSELFCYGQHFYIVHIFSCSCLPLAADALIVFSAGIASYWDLWWFPV